MEKFLEKLHVTILDEFYKNDDFHCYAGIHKGRDIKLTTSGFELATRGETVVMGTFAKHQIENDTIKVHHEEINLNNKQTMINLLSNVEGIGEKKANDIFSVVDDIFIFEKSDNEIPEIPGFGKKSRQNLFPLIREELEKLKTLTLFNKLQLLLKGSINAKKIKLISENINSIDELYENTYKCLIDTCECSFLQADKVSRETLNVDLKNKHRLEYLTEYILKKSLSAGNCYSPYQDFELELIKYSELLDEDNKKLICENQRIVVEDNCCYPKDLHEAETQTPILLKELNKKIKHKLNLNKQIKKTEDKIKLTFDQSQKNAIDKLVNSSVSILTGFAGCGKTTIVKTVVDILEREGELCRLLAPTGKASRVLSIKTDKQANTIHSFIYNPDSFYDVLIVDEFSMCDLWLFYKLLKVVKENGYKKLILIGDPGQLPSVQNGNVLHDMIQSKQIAHAHLDKIHRQGQNSDIIKLATLTRTQQKFEFNIKNCELFCFPCSDEKQYAENFFKTFVHIKDKEEYRDIDDFYNDVQVITPLKKNVDEINQIIKKTFNPKNPQYFDFNVGDKVMNTKNSKQYDIYNGEIGRCIEITKKDFTVYFKSLEKKVTFTNDYKINFKLAYCSTVHKLQGSEYKHVILILPSNNPFLDSRIIYTAVTRAKKSLVILSEKQILNGITSRNHSMKRLSKLSDRMIKDDVSRNLEKENKKLALNRRLQDV